MVATHADLTDNIDTDEVKGHVQRQLDEYNAYLATELVKVRKENQTFILN